MLTLHGKEVHESLEELAAPAHTALLVIDMQNESCKPDGLYGVLDLSLYQRAIPVIRRVRESAAASGVFVINVRNVFTEENLSRAELRHLWVLHRCKYGNATHALENVETSGGRGCDFIDELLPGEGEVVLTKQRPSAFAGTQLDLLLRSNRIETVVLTGIVTEGCIEWTAREAHSLDYYVVVVADGVASDDARLHEAALTTMRVNYEVAESDELLGIWRAKSQR
jgi:nicotinamidase-related amidase